MRFQLRHNAGDHNRFAATAFDSQIGQFTEVMVNHRPAGVATLVAAEVVDDGRTALLTYKIHNFEVAAFLRADLLTHTGAGLSFRIDPAEQAPPTS